MVISSTPSDTSIRRASPKSATLAENDASIRMLAGLMSRCSNGVSRPAVHKKASSRLKHTLPRRRPQKHAPTVMQVVHTAHNAANHIEHGLLPRIVRCVIQQVFKRTPPGIFQHQTAIVGIVPTRSKKTHQVWMSQGRHDFHLSTKSAHGLSRHLCSPQRPVCMYVCVRS